MNDAQQVRPKRWLSIGNNCQWSIRSMLFLASMIAYLLCIFIYYPDAAVTGIRIAMSGFLIAGMSQQILECQVSSEGGDARYWPRRKIVLLALLGSIILFGVLSTIHELFPGKRHWDWVKGDYAYAWRRGLSTTWTLAIFLSTLTCPWMASEASRNGLRPKRSIVSWSSCTLLGITLIGISVICNGLTTALVLLSCNGLLLGMSSPASAFAQVPLDGSNRLLQVEGVSIRFAAFWISGIVGGLAFLASLYLTPNSSKMRRRLLTGSLIIMLICLASIVWVVGWGTRELSPPIADSYALMPTVYLITLLVPAFLLAIYFVTRCPQLQSESLQDDYQNPRKSTMFIWSNSAWIGVLLIALPYSTYKDVVKCLLEVHANSSRLFWEIENSMGNEDTRLNLFLAIFGIQWLNRRIRFSKNSGPRWPYVSSTQWSVIPMAWLVVIVIIMVSVPFSVGFWLL